MSEDIKDKIMREACEHLDGAWRDFVLSSASEYDSLTPHEVSNIMIGICSSVVLNILRPILEIQEDAQQCESLLDRVAAAIKMYGYDRFGTHRAEVPQYTYLVKRGFSFDDDDEEMH